METAAFDGMYTGCDYDAETGLTYHWNRWRSEDGSCFISEDPIRDGANWYGYAGQNPMVYVDRIGLFAYGADGQQHSTNTNQTATESAEKKNSEAPNITGGGPSGEQTPPPVPNVETDGENRKIGAVDAVLRPYEPQKASIKTDKVEILYFLK